MAKHVSTDVAILGAGVIGLSIALRLAAEGREVVLVDPGTPGMGASYGNAGTIADYAVMPVGTPDVLRNLPSLLFDRNSPLAIRRAALPALLPWLVRFARQSLPGATRANAAALAHLLSGAGPSWQELAAEVGGAGLIRREGCLYLYETAAGGRAAERDLTTRRALGIKVERLTPDELAVLEPGLPPMAGGAAHFTGAIFLSDPGRMMALMAAEADRRGVQVLPYAARKLTRQIDGIIVEGDGLRLHAKQVVIAAGAHSRDLARQAGDRVPLDTERGYHLEWDAPPVQLSRPSCPTSRGFYLCPMTGRLRVAGTVELGGLTAPPSPHRLRRLEAGARAIFPQLGAPDRTWMGFRPSLPDSRPVIGPSRGGSDVVHAFGHGHIGLTLAPVTARLVADVLAGRPTEIALDPYLPTRF